MGTPIRPLLDWEVFSIDRKSHPLRGKVVAVDANNLLGQSLFHHYNFDSAGNWSPRRDREGRVVAHLEVLLPRLLSWFRAGIEPIFCFDGKASRMKCRVDVEDPIRWYADMEHCARENVRRGRPNIARQILIDRRLAWEYCLRETRELLKALGVPYVNGVAEGEAQACHLATTGVASAVVTQDYDALLYNAPLIVRNLKSSARGRGWNGRVARPELVRTGRVLELREISLFQLVDVAILLGTDYNEGVRGIGPVRGLNLVKYHGSLEGILESAEVRRRFDLSPVEDSYEVVRDQFLSPPVNANFPPPKWRTPFPGRVRELVLEEHGLAGLWGRVGGALDALAHP
ncbi:MAG: hypothetical protein ACTSU5_01940 [Promethearchaeota archaeon]